MLRMSVLLFLILSSTLWAKKDSESPCESVKIEVDDFGDSTIGDFYHIGWGNLNGIGLTKKGETIELNLLYFQGGDKDVVIPAGATALLALTDGSVVKCSVSENIVPNSWFYQDANQIVTSWKVNCSVTSDQLKQLAQAPAKASKCKVGNNELSFKVKKRAAEKIMSIAACLSSNK